jgi:catechol 2,3-dioxygenase-like lactoylglutathione lyase family enzyme
VLDHIALEVDDLARSASFYDALMRPLGGRRIVDSPEGIGYGRDRPELWLMPRNGADGRGANGRPGADGPVQRRGHVAIAAFGRRAVDAAHEAGIAAGGRDGGKPAPRRFGPPNYYSGYLVDPDGAWLELVSGSQ